jgi:hypothetical protein
MSDCAPVFDDRPSTLATMPAQVLTTLAATSKKSVEPTVRMFPDKHAGALDN